MLISPKPKIIDLTEEPCISKSDRRQSRLGPLKEKRLSGSPNLSVSPPKSGSKGRSGRRSLHHQALHKALGDEQPGRDMQRSPHTPKGAWEASNASCEVEMQESGSIPKSGSSRGTGGSRRSSKRQSSCLSQATRDAIALLNESGGMWSDDSPLVKSLSQSHREPQHQPEQQSNTAEMTDRCGLSGLI